MCGLAVRQAIGALREDITSDLAADLTLMPKLQHLDADGLGHFTQAQAAEPTATLHQMAGCVHQGEAGLLLLFGAGQHWWVGFVGKYSDAL